MLAEHVNAINQLASRFIKPVIREETTSPSLRKGIGDFSATAEENTLGISGRSFFPQAYGSAIGQSTNSTVLQVSFDHIDLTHYEENEGTTYPLEECFEIQMLSDTDIQEIIKKYENKFGMSSEEFTRKWKADEVPDTFETNDWAILLSID